MENPTKHIKSEQKKLPKNLSEHFRYSEMVQARRIDSKSFANQISYIIPKGNKEALTEQDIMASFQTKSLNQERYAALK